MTDIVTRSVTPQDLLTSAHSHLAVARRTIGEESEHHAILARRYTSCADLLSHDPLAAPDINDVVSHLRDAQRQGPHTYSDPDSTDHLDLAAIRLHMARVVSRGRLEN